MVDPKWWLKFSEMSSLYKIFIVVAGKKRFYKIQYRGLESDRRMIYKYNRDIVKIFPIT